MTEQHPVDKAYQEAQAKAAARPRGRTWRQYRGPRPGEIEAWLSSHANVMKREANNELRFNPCPVCHRDKKQLPSMTINAETGLWQCHACHGAGNWFTLTRAFGYPLGEDDRYEPDANAIDFTAARAAVAGRRKAKSSLLTEGKYPALLEYAMSRGFTRETLDAWLVTSLGEDCVRWPLHALDEKGEWVLVNAKIKRCLDKDAGAKSWFEIAGGPTGLLVGQHLFNSKHGKRVIITEGEWDAMAGYQCGLRNIGSIPNGASHVAVGSMLRYIPEDWEVWLAVDHDAPGDKCAELFYRQLGFERVARLMMPHKDLNEWMLKVPNLTSDAILATAKGVTALATSGATSVEVCPDKPRFRTASRTNRSVGNKIITSLPWPGLTDLLSGGLRASETTSFLAPSGVGKTTVINQIAVHAALSGVKVAVISVEGSLEEADIRMIEATAGWTGHSEGSDEFNEVLGLISMSNLSGVKVSWRDCIKDFEDRIKDGCQLLLMDNFDFIMSRTDANTHNVKAEAFANLSNLAKENKVHAISVWQPNKIDRVAHVNSGNQKGLSQMLQDSDNYINMNVQSNLRKLEVEKHRHGGIIEGKNSVMLLYKTDKRILIELAKDDPRITSKEWSGVKTDF